MDTTMKVVVGAAVLLMVGLGVSFVFNDQFGVFSETATTNTQSSSCDLLIQQGKIIEAKAQGCQVCRSGFSYIGPPTLSDPICCSGGWTGTCSGSQHPPGQIP